MQNVRAYKDLPTFQVAWELQGWRDTPEGGVQRDPASLPLMQGHSLLCHCLMTLARSLVYYGWIIVIETVPCQRLLHGSQSRAFPLVQK